MYYVYQKLENVTENFTEKYIQYSIQIEIEICCLISFEPIKYFKIQLIPIYNKFKTHYNKI